jgi:hypothetical protein
MLVRRRLPFVVLVVLVAGCGGADEKAADPVTALKSSVRDDVRGAQSVDPAGFPKPSGESLEAFAGNFDTNGPQAVAASSVFTPRRARLAFGLLDENLHFVYGKTVVYLQRRGGGPILGPFAAPADVLVTQPRYRSRQAASEKDPFAAIYAAEVPVSKPGIWNALTVSDTGGRKVAALMSFQATSAAKDKIPAVGEKAPAVQTDTPESLKGNTDLLDTRQPPALELSKTSFADVVGKKPVALLFATPQLCQSRVCGPVVDEMLQLRAKYGDKMTFIHQEVYADNDVNKGLRKPLQAFHLPTEPWLFTVRADGTIAARLEGSIGLRAFEDAIKAAL